MGTRLGGALRGCGLGLARRRALVPARGRGNWAAGGVAPRPHAQAWPQLDLGLAAAAGLVLGAILPRGGVTLGLAMGAAYGFLRVFEPPGMGPRPSSCSSRPPRRRGRRTWLARRDGHGRPRLRARGAPRRGGGARPRLRARRHARPARCAACACRSRVAAAAAGGGRRGPAHRALIRRRGMRLALEVAAAAIALAVLGKPLSTAPLENRVVTAVPPPKGTPDVFLISMDTTRADHLADG